MDAIERLHGNRLAQHARCGGLRAKAAPHFRAAGAKVADRSAINPAELDKFTEGIWSRLERS